MEWLSNNWVTLVAAYVAVKEAVKLISKLTPWKGDDYVAEWLEKIGNTFFRK